MERMKEIFRKVAVWLGGLSFRTGLMVLGVCVMCYVLSFAQMLLPTSVGVKGALWVVFYGLAKASQYTAIAILGKAGFVRIKMALRGGRESK